MGRKIFTFIFCTLLIAPFVLFVTFLAVWFQPDLLINKTTANLIDQNYFHWNIDWDKIDFEISKDGFFETNVKLHLKDYCFIESKDKTLCLDHFDLDSHIRHGFLEIFSVEIKTFSVKDQKIFWSLASSSQKESSPSDREPLNIEEQIQNLKQKVALLPPILFKDIDVHIENTTLQTSKLSFEIKAQMTDPEKLDWSLKASDQSTILSGTFKYQPKNHLLSTQIEGSVYQIPSTVQGEVSLSGESDLSTKLHLESTLPHQNQNFQLRADLKAQLSASELLLDLKPLALTPPRDFPIQYVEVGGCHGVFEFGMKEPEDPRLSCSPISILFNPNKIQNSQFAKEVGAEKIPFPKELLFSIKSLVPKEWLRGKFSENPIEFEFSMNPVSERSLEAEFEGRMDLAYEDEHYKIEDPELNLSITATQFQSLVHLLEGTAYAIPAPLNQMKGSLQLKSQSGLKFDSEHIEIPFEFSTRLAEKNNELDTTTKGQFIWPLKNKSEIPKLTLKILLNKFYLQLPNLDPLRGIPKVTTDSRIQTKKTTAESQQKKIQLDVSVQTSEPGAIRIYHKFLEPYAPLSLNLNVNPQMSYTLKKPAENFKINYLRRTVEVTDLQLKQNPKEDEPSVSGRIQYQANEYTVFMEFKGPLSEPQVVLSSSPPLERRDIVSLLLYNRLNSEISTFESQSVGGTEAALADRAVGLLGLWAFASTPIESVSYDPGSRTYSAQIKLPEGFRFSIGTDWEKVENLELRRHLGGNWIVRTIYHPEQSDQSSSGEIRLQRKVNY